MRRKTTRWLSRHERARTWALLAPGTLWLVAFFVAPILIMAAYSVMERGTYGGVESGFTLESYARFFDPLYLRILVRTLGLAALTTAICLVVGYPLAYAIAGAGRWKHALLFLVVLPFWTSFLVRTYAIMFLLRDTGLVNSVLMAIGVIERPVTLLYTPGAVLAGLVYGYLPFMVLPVYA
ncbi:MAG TPA: ABC transporter permease, partial [Gemmatimonadota bacterium]|nr:ABC transporter permease [Gemmatimonadota bacterium]